MNKFLKKLFAPIMNEVGAFGLKDILFGSPSEEQKSQQSTTTTRPVEIPGIFGRDEAAGFARQAGGLVGADNPFMSMLMNMFNNPNFSGPGSDALISKVMEGLQGRFNRLGVGASPNADDIASGIAPALIGLRSNEFSNVFQGLQSFDAGRELDLNALLSLAGLGVPQVASKTDQQMTSQGTSVGGTDPLVNFSVPLPIG